MDGKWYSKEVFILDKKILPVFKPFMDLLPKYAHYFAITEWCENLENWMCNNFMLFYFTKRTDFNTLLFQDSNFKTYNAFSFLYTNVDDLPNPCIEVIKAKINEGYYINMNIDLFYISCSSKYGKFHLIHPNLVYGYDDEKEEFFICDFYDGFHYSSATIHYQEWQNAFAKTNYHQFHPDHKKVIFLKNEKDNNFHIDINIKVIIEKMEEYLNANSKVAFLGLNIYQEINELFSKSDGSDINIKLFAHLVEHKRIMLIRLNKIEKETGVDLQTEKDQCQKAMDIATILKNLIIKCAITEQIEKQRIENHLKNISEIEEIYMLNTITKVNQWRLI